jgi:flagellar basal-body rod protein FlgG
MIVSNNLANVSTTGYKQDVPAVSNFPDLLMIRQGGDSTVGATSSQVVGPLGVGSELEEIQLDLAQGDLLETDSALDLAISGPGFFAIDSGSDTLYTRDGAFHRDAVGRLARSDGGLLLGEDGPIQVGEGNIIVDGDGAVSVDGQIAGRIRLVDFDAQESLIKLGDNYFVPENADAQTVTPQNAAINQGFLERSNVDVTRASVEMLSALRSYEASLKMVQMQDETLERVVNEIGRV